MIGYENSAKPCFLATDVCASKFSTQLHLSAVLSMGPPETTGAAGELNIKYFGHC